MTRTLTILAALACIGAGVFALSNRSPAPADPLLGAAFAQNAADVDTSMITEMRLGNPDAAVTVIEYASFTCPHCASFHAGNFKQLKKDYIDTDKINFVYREVYFDRPGLWAAIVARCGDGAEARYFGLIDMIYERQSQWVRANSPQETVDQLRTIGKTGGLTDAQLDQCFTDASKAEAMYARFQQTTEEHGINSTPSFIINGEKYSNMSYDEFKDILDSALGS